MLRLQGADQTHSSETYKRQMHIHHFCWVTQRFWWSDLLHVCCIILNDVKGLTGSKVWGMWGPHIVTAHCLCINTCLCVRKSIHIVLFTAYIQVLVYNLVSEEVGPNIALLWMLLKKYINATVHHFTFNTWITNRDKKPLLSVETIQLRVQSSCSESALPSIRDEVSFVRYSESITSFLHRLPLQPQRHPAICVKKRTDWRIFMVHSSA